VKPALRRPFGVSTNTRRRRCGIRLTIANGRVNGCERPPARDKPSDGMGAGAGRARATVQHVGRPDYFPRVAWSAKKKVHQIYARLSPPGDRSFRMSRIAENTATPMQTRASRPWRDTSLLAVEHISHKSGSIRL
jgi:hypothetical protein